MHPQILRDKVAIVTGAGQGIGRGYALGLAREGARLVVADIAEGPAQDTVALIRAEGLEAEMIRTDVSDAQSSLAMAAFEPASTARTTAQRAPS